MPGLGKFIAIYGINNLGKTTQAQMLVRRINESSQNGVDCIYLKYPLYDLVPTGPVINDYLRSGNPLRLSPQTFQVLNVLNRNQFDGIVRAHLTLTQTDESDRFTHIVAEDYIGTGIAWGVGAGVDEEFLIELNTHLVNPDIAFLFDGKRFDEGREEGHTHESNDDLTERVRLIHLDLARKFGWHVVNANRPREIIHEEIWSKVEPLLGK